MECKVVKKDLQKFIKRDLIDTLWNVKDGHVVTPPRYFDDLIDTLWNVKIVEPNQSVAIRNLI